MKTKSTQPYKRKDTKNIVEEPAMAYATPATSSYNTFVLQDRYSLVKKSRSGVGTDIFYDFAEKINFPEKKLAALLNLSPRTMSNYRDQNKTIEANYSEHLLKLIALFELGKEYLGSYDEFKKWLERPFWGTDDKPEEFLNTSGGVDIIMERLERMAQGYPI